MEDTSSDRKRIRLCLSSLNYPPFFGGAALRFSRYLPRLRERGVDGTVFTCLQIAHEGDPDLSRGHSSRDAGRLLEPERMDGVPVQRIVLKSPRMRGQVGLYARRLRAFCLEGPERPDVVHILNLHKWYVPTLRALRAAGIPVVFSHTLIGRHSRNPIRRLYQESLLTVPYRYVDAVVTSTDVMRDWLRAHGVTNRVEVIPNGVDVRRFRPVGEREVGTRALRSSLGIGRDERVVFSVGAIQPRKRTELLVRAWIEQRKKGVRSHLVIAGPVRDNKDPRQEYLGRLLELVRGAGVEKELHLVGSVGGIEEYYRAADLFVLTSEREGMNNAIFEAMASGVPVLTVPFEGLSAAHGVPGVHFALTERDPEPQQLAAAMDRLLGPGPERDTLARGGREWAETEADVERVLDRYAELYRELVAGARGGPLRTAGADAEPALRSGAPAG